VTQCDLRPADGRDNAVQRNFVLGLARPLHRPMGAVRVPSSLSI